MTVVKLVKMNITNITVAKIKMHENKIYIDILYTSNIRLKSQGTSVVWCYCPWARV